MASKDELTAAEAEAWASFSALVDRIPEERLETPALDAGWSVKDVLWHVAFWWDDFVRAAREGWKGLDGETDDINQREYERSRALPFVDVQAKLEESRASMLAMWAGLDAVTPDIEQWLRDETIEHYAEHEPQVRSIAEDPGVRGRGA